MGNSNIRMILNVVVTVITVLYSYNSFRRHLIKITIILIITFISIIYIFRLQHLKPCVKAIFLQIWFLLLLLIIFTNHSISIIISYFMYRDGSGMSTCKLLLLLLFLVITVYLIYFVSILLHTYLSWLINSSINHRWCLQILWLSAYIQFVYRIWLAKMLISNITIIITNCIAKRLYHWLLFMVIKQV